MVVPAGLRDAFDVGVFELLQFFRRYFPPFTCCMEAEITLWQVSEGSLQLVSGPVTVDSHQGFAVSEFHFVDPLIMLIGGVSFSIDLFALPDRFERKIELTDLFVG